MERTLQTLRAQRPPFATQSGAALIVGLVLMMVLTILAVSTMRTSTLELAMSGNAQYREKAQQLAEAGITDAISRINDINDPLNDELVTVNPGIWTPGILAGELVPASGDTYTVDIRYLHGGSPPPGSGYGESIPANYFEFQSTGRTAARNARVVVRQGFWVTAQ